MGNNRSYTLEVTWGTSRGRDSYGYTTCSLRVDGKRRAYCNGGGYDMRGTVVANFIASEFRAELNALKAKDMPKQSHWERADPIPRVCRNLDCIIKNGKVEDHGHTDAETCPHCGEPTEFDYRAGKTVQDGRYFYGLRYIDPDYNPYKAKLEHSDGTFTSKEDEGKTFEQLQEEGKVVDLAIYQTAYKATSPHPTKRHTIPHIDGACGLSSVEQIIKALGYELRHIVNKSKLDVFELIPKQAAQEKAA
jgi:hypothetical protein